MSNELLTPTEFAAIAKVHPRTVRRWAAEGKIRSVTLPSGRVRIPAAALEELAEPEVAS